MIWRNLGKPRWEAWEYLRRVVLKPEECLLQENPLRASAAKTSRQAVPRGVKASSREGTKRDYRMAVSLSCQRRKGGLDFSLGGERTGVNM